MLQRAEQDQAAGEAVARALSMDSASPECAICLTNPKNCAIVPCGHISTCEPCANSLIAQGLHCPICRGPITMAVRVFVA